MLRRGLVSQDQVKQLISTTAQAATTGHETADLAKTLGSDCFGMDIVQDVLGIRMPLVDQLYLQRTLPSAETARSLAGTHMLLADPGISLIALRECRTVYFFTKLDAWYDTERFARATHRASWLWLRKAELAGTTCLSYLEQVQFLEQPDQVPHVRELVLAMIIAMDVKSERLFEGVGLRTGDIAATGSRLNVGSFDSDGLRIGDDWGDYRSPTLALTSCRRIGAP
jgi:hypothetical protein